jgi:phospholipid N-methyltransferase
MPPSLREYRLFVGEFLRTYHTTGAVLPSGAALARALTRYVQPGERPLAILEVGPGSGAVTAQLVRRMGPEDRLDLVELNERFVACLRERFEREEPFRRVAEQTEIFHRSVEEMADRGPYDCVISGLPLNNFEGETVERLIQAMMHLVRPGGTLSFFEYIAIRRAKSLVSSGKTRARLRHVGRAMDALLGEHEIRRDRVLLNAPPAWAHHVRAPGPTERPATP